MRLGFFNYFIVKNAVELPETKRSSIMKKTLSLVLFTAISISTVATAQESYVGANFQLGTYEEDGISTSPKLIELKAGYYVTETVALEGRFGFTLSPGVLDAGGLDIEVGASSISGFVKGGMPVSATTNLYGLLGITSGTLTASALGVSLSEKRSGLSYGFGIETSVQEGLNLQAEYVSYLRGEEFGYEWSYSGINIGLSKSF
jgi:opacity protein-like surface antigen